MDRSSEWIPGHTLLLLLLFICSNTWMAAQAKPPRSERVQSQPTSRYITVRRLRIHYLEWNRRGTTAVILLHGLYDGADTWAKVAPELAEEHRVIALDRRGSGRTSAPPNGYDFGTLARDVASVIDKLGVRRAHIVGHSAGAGVALTLAANSGEKIASVSLVDGGFWDKRHSGSTPSCSENTPACRRRLAIERGSMEYDPQPLYPRVTMPALLVLGVPPRSEAEQFASQLQEARAHVEDVAAKKLKSGRLVLIPETGHWIQRDKPRELAAELKRFFRETAPGPVSAKPARKSRR